MTQIEAEKKLMEYAILEKRVETLMKQSKRAGLVQIALSQGPKDIKPTDLTEPRIQCSHEPWIDRFFKAYERLNKKLDQISDEMQTCLERQTDIRIMVEGAGLDDDERLYCNLRYFEGKTVKELEAEWKSKAWLADVKKTALQKITGITA